MPSDPHVPDVVCSQCGSVDAKKVGRLNGKATRLGALIALTIVTAFAEVAYGGDTKLVVPSAATAAALESLARRTDVVADVLTVERKEYVLALDGSGGDAFSGRRSDASTMMHDDQSTVRIPLDKLALVYYAETPASTKSAPPAGRASENASPKSYPLAKSLFPVVPAVGDAERGMNCQELEREITRAGTIRWYARQHLGAIPFTRHEAAVQHADNALRGVAIGVGVAIALVGAAGGGGVSGLGGMSGGAAPADYSPGLEAYRWAVTAADGRELGLLALKRERACPSTAVPSGARTDLELLGEVEATHRALEARQISDVDQRNQQTGLLDQLDPPPSATVRLLSARESAAQDAAQKSWSEHEAQFGAAGTPLAQYRILGIVYSPRCRWSSDWKSLMRGVTVVVAERAVVWDELHEDGSHHWRGIEYADLADATVEQHFLHDHLRLRRRDGSCDFFMLSDHKVAEANALIRSQQAAAGVDRK
jgi:hypothetical protein